MAKNTIEGSTPATNQRELPPKGKRKKADKLMTKQRILVHEMTSPVEVIATDTPVADAYNFMMRKGVTNSRQ
jgi:hypothetical protein